jgi:RHS repeat-associated protein
VDTSGTVQASIVTDEYGNPTSSTGSATLLHHSFWGALGVWNETGTPSGAPVSNLGLYLAGQRWWSPSIARWLTPEPLGFAASLNLYTVAKNSPHNFVDPSGLAPTRYLNSEDETQLYRQALSLIMRNGSNEEYLFLRNIAERRHVAVGAAENMNGNAGEARGFGRSSWIILSTNLFRAVPYRFKNCQHNADEIKFIKSVILAATLIHERAHILDTLNPYHTPDERFDAELNAFTQEFNFLDRLSQSTDLSSQQRTDVKEIIRWDRLVEYGELTDRASGH